MYLVNNSNNSNDVSVCHRISVFLIKKILCSYEHEQPALVTKKLLYVYIVCYFRIVYKYKYNSILPIYYNVYVFETP